MTPPTIGRAVAKLAPVVLVAALLAATAAAFVYTEQLKLTPSPILGTRVDKLFSPVCECETDAATIFFRLREADRLTAEIIDSRGTVVRELVRNRREARGPVELQWDGRDEQGVVVREGSYRPRIHLTRDRRTIVLPNRIRVDTTRPRVELLSLRPRVFSPDGDRRRDSVTARYRVDEPASVVLYVDGVRRVRKRGTRTEGLVRWPGTTAGPLLAEGTYGISLGARDLAGNLAVPTPERRVLARYVSLGRHRIVVAPGGRFAVLVLSHAATIEWRLGARSGTTRPGTLRLVAPGRSGRFVLTVTANGSSERAVVVVRGGSS
jgi:hypothetical protein